MSTFHLYCSCIICKRELTVQNLGAHHQKHSTPPLLCQVCNQPITIHSKNYCSRSCAATHSNSTKDWTNIKTGPAPGYRKPTTQYTKIAWCPVCGRAHTKSGTCSKLCKSKLLSKLMKERIYNGFVPNRNRGRGKQSYLESSFEHWVSVHFPELEVIPEYPVRRLDTTKTYFADFYFPSKQLIIELDGTQHQYTTTYDNDRDAYILSTYGIKVIRITHQEYISQSRVPEIMSFLSESN